MRQWNSGIQASVGAVAQRRQIGFLLTSNGTVWIMSTNQWKICLEKVPFLTNKTQWSWLQETNHHQKMDLLVSRSPLLVNRTNRRMYWKRKMKSLPLKSVKKYMIKLNLYGLSNRVWCFPCSTLLLWLN